MQLYKQTQYYVLTANKTEINSNSSKMNSPLNSYFLYISISFKIKYYGLELANKFTYYINVLL